MEWINRSWGAPYKLLRSERKRASQFTGNIWGKFGEKLSVII